MLSEKRNRGTLGVDGNVLSLDRGTGYIVQWFVKTNQTVDLRSVHFTMYKL